MAPAKSMKSAAKAVAKPKKKTAKSYARPASIKLGTILTDNTKKQWKVGPSVGSGGFGDIYSCCSADASPKKATDYPHVVKIVRIIEDALKGTSLIGIRTLLQEPHANGPLFVEMHLYSKICKKDDSKQILDSAENECGGLLLFARCS